MIQRLCPYCGATPATLLPTCAGHADLILLDEWWRPEAEAKRREERREAREAARAAELERRMGLRFRMWWLDRYSWDELRDLAAGLEAVA